ncbi:uracil-DNA glycosylase [Aliiruegeria lutimaris]|uniref:Uracil DNA glycosylase superfamily protein n=1 Tax=Aliiruegeria lutimaris TaxID=571298 RepID=A0A1G9MF48_9RHOB|nr:uracil-DNA glycosylase [Aliiruegeria lutimaris]SDL72898.1 Uracil DNA glycosylase superfamily protein [Aliiruegeria lutimaris]
MKQLEEYTSKLRALKPDCEVPDFSSSGPGTDAKLLFLLAKPGTRGAGVTNVVDPLSNDDQTARNMRQIMEEIDLDPNRVLYWNVVPWFDGKRDVTAAEVNEGKRQLRGLLELLPALKAVVLVGKHAQRASDAFEGSGVRVFRTAHCGPLVKAANRDQFDAIGPVWKAASDYAFS